MIKNNDVRVGSSKARGFSLIELVVTIAIMGILTGIALSTYRDQTAKARRADAGAALLAGAQALERYYSTNGRYTTAKNGSTLAPVFATQSPENGTAFYTIGKSAADDNSFTLQATRVGAMANDACGNLTLTNAGVMGMNGNASGMTAADCWRR